MFEVIMEKAGGGGGGCVKGEEEGGKKKYDFECFGVKALGWRDCN